ncbi:MAG: hypothetical protein Fur0011_2960 [Candidatus Microgenomates bacterium]
MKLVEMGVDVNTEKFLLSDGFESLLIAMQAINSTTDTETAGFLAKLSAMSFVVNWSRSGGDGSIFSVVSENDLRVENGQVLLRERGFPQIDIQNGKKVMQLTISTGEQSINEFKFPPSIVVEEYSRIMAARLEEISGRYGSMHTTYYDSMLLAVQRDGGVKISERPYNSRWKLNIRASIELAKHLNTNVLYRDLAQVS